MKNIGNFKSHICKSCAKFGKLDVVKICGSCDKKDNILEDITKMNCYEMFDLKPSFNIDKKLLDKEYKSIQKIVHPDIISSLNDNQAIKEALEVSSLVTKYYDILRKDYDRAIFLV